MMREPSGGLSNLQLRLISGLVLACVVLFATWLGGFAFRLVAVVIGAAVYTEWRAITANGTRLLVARIAELALVTVFAVILAGMSNIVVFPIIVLAIGLACLALAVGHANIWLPIGLAYGSIPCASLVFLRGEDGQGAFSILFLFAVVWATDIFAYFFGRSIGGAKLAPKISPNKTWSGAIGGTAAAVGAGLGLASIFGTSSNPVLPLIIVFISVVAQMGDLFESWIKRRFGVKDSGAVIPGHGGVMDRVDGLFAAAAVLYLLKLTG